MSIRAKLVKVQDSLVVFGLLASGISCLLILELYDFLFKRKGSISLKKEEKVKKAFEELYSRRQTMKCEEIISEIYRIHHYYMIPLFSSSSDNTARLWFCTMMEEIYDSSNLQAKHIDLVADMLSWIEIRNNPDGNVRACVLKLLEKFPAPLILPRLKDHLDFLKDVFKDIKPYAHYYVSLRQEIERVENLIKKLGTLYKG